MEEYLVPTGFGQDEFTEKKSRFIGRVWLVETEDEALAKIQDMKKQHYDATHNCWAYIIKDGAVRFSDDGEPGGTAGMPMLQVLQREGLYNIVCVVTRYFGGILLGAGGLVRAIKSIVMVSCVNHNKKTPNQMVRRFSLSEKPIICWQLRRSWRSRPASGKRRR